MNKLMGSMAEPKQIIGFLLYVMAIFLLAAMDASAKWLVTRYPVAEIVFLRALFSFGPILAAGIVEQQPLRLSSKVWPLLILRGTLVLGTIGAFFFSVQGLPLATATAISMSSPILMAVFGAKFLGERVSVWRWAFIFLGFVGVLFTIEGFSASASIFTVAALLSALLYAVSALLTKRLAQTEPAFLIAIYTNALMLVFSISGFTSGWAVPGWDDALVFAFLGLCGGIGNYIYTVALRFSNMSAVAPFEYSIIVWAALFGLSLFGEIPTILTAFGAFLIVASGVATIQRRS